LPTNGGANRCPNHFKPYHLSVSSADVISTDIFPFASPPLEPPNFSSFFQPNDKHSHRQSVNTPDCDADIKQPYGVAVGAANSGANWCPD